jgi:hypothetical protein
MSCRLPARADEGEPIVERGVRDAGAAWIASMPRKGVDHPRVSKFLTPSAIAVAHGCQREIALISAAPAASFS